MLRPARHGFTRTELIVVTVVLVLLASLLLTRGSRPHALARRMQCMNNQRQIAEAMELYASTHFFIPPSLSPRINPTTKAQLPRPFSWVQGMWAELGRSDIAPHSFGMTAADAPICPLLICPADGAKYSASGGPLCYVVNGGSFKHWQPDGNFDCLDRGAWELQGYTPGNSSPGKTLAYIAKVKGLALTISHSENLDARSYILTSNEADYEDSILWDPSAPLGFNEDAGNGKLDNAHARPSSNHPGGAVVTFCDGHVAFISDSINYNVYATLMAVDPLSPAPPNTGPLSANPPNKPPQAPPGSLSKFLVWPLNPSLIPTE